MHLHDHTQAPDLTPRTDLPPDAETSTDLRAEDGAEAAVGVTPDTTASHESERDFTGEEAAAVARQYKMIPHRAVKERYKGKFEKADKYDALATHMSAVAKKYGVPLDDPAALALAILGDDAPPEVTLISEERLPAEGEESAKTDPPAVAASEAAAQDSFPATPATPPNGAQYDDRVRREEYARLARQEAETRKAYPDFDFATAAQSPAFRLLVDSGIPIKEAFEMSHHATLYAAALAAAREEGRAEAQAQLEAEAERPREGGICHTAASPADPAALRGKALDAFLESFLTK